MRTPKYLSPSGIACFEKDRVEWYLRYAADDRPPKLPQTQPMAAGSAFDAYAKAFLYSRLIGDGRPEYTLEALFETQVEPHNRDWARRFGAYSLERYLACGAMAGLMNELQQAVGPPRFEFEITGLISGSGPVPLTGRPDIFFINAEGARVVYDFKVNGAAAASPVSPKPGYVICRDGWNGGERKGSRNAGMPHPACVPTAFRGIKINPQIGLEDVDESWARQLAIYAWLLGEDVGSQGLVVGIDQLCGSGQRDDGMPWLRVASHRCRIGMDYQLRLLERIQEIWSVTQSGWIFRDLTEAESLARQADLDTSGLCGEDDFSKFMNSCRSQ